MVPTVAMGYETTFELLTKIVLQQKVLLYFLNKRNVLSDVNLSTVFWPSQNGKLNGYSWHRGQDLKKNCKK